jgi:hypothetical protein
VPNNPDDMASIIRELEKRVTRAERAAANISNVSLGKGYVGFTAITANSGNVTNAGGEAIIFSIANVPIEDGRAYEIGVASLMSMNDDNCRPQLRVRKNTITGSVYILWHDTQTRIADAIVASGTFVNYGFVRKSILVRTAGLGDETMTLRLTLENVNATGTVRLAGSTTSSCGYFYCKDIGAAPDFPSVNVLGA